MLNMCGVRRGVSTSANCEIWAVWLRERHGTAGRHGTALPHLLCWPACESPASCLLPPLPPASCHLPPPASCHLPRIVAYHPPLDVEAEFRVQSSEFILDVEARGDGDDQFRVAGGSPPRGGPAVFPQAQDKARSSLTLSACRANKGLWRGAGEPAFKGE